MTNAPLLIAIVGPTAVGKTALALELAQRLPIEVVSADSRQVYRGMDIGTAKPTAAERAAVRHHLLDVANPDEAYTLAHYRQDASLAIADIHRRGRLPVLVGGTGLYVRVVTEGLEVPAVAPDLDYRAALEARAARDGASALHGELAERDPAAASTIDPRNIRRVIRALEVLQVTGRPFSSQQLSQAPAFHTLRFGLTLERAALYRRIDQRVDAMMAVGFLEEVQSLHTRGSGWYLPSMSGLGYRQLGEHLRGERTLVEAVERIKFDTHAYVRRQYTWFRKDDRIEWHDTEDVSALMPAITRQIDLARSAGAAGGSV